jgi:hypothetical protein
MLVMFCQTKKNQVDFSGLSYFLYTFNDMSDTVMCKLLLYADDSDILVLGMDTVYIEETLSKDLHFVRDWLSDNKLSLHLGKNSSILLG